MACPSRRELALRDRLDSLSWSSCLYSSSRTPFSCSHNAIYSWMRSFSRRNCCSLFISTWIKLYFALVCWLPTIWCFKSLFQHSISAKFSFLHVILQFSRYLFFVAICLPLLFLEVFWADQDTLSLFLWISSNSQPFSVAIWSSCWYFPFLGLFFWLLLLARYPNQSDSSFCFLQKYSLAIYSYSKGQRAPILEFW